MKEKQDTLNPISADRLCVSAILSTNSRRRNQETHQYCVALKTSRTEPDRQGVGLAQIEKRNLRLCTRSLVTTRHTF
ncbi:hypothetical protein KIN20_003095 [Parelaphostrongylus tenuis]|uniref:Uncharacterized protein n=1 Tax=Parelaphostrongylus tenuis TaxID=148309 RepID=A0AAD5LYN2_PARTN|nr:hypothetical protein KIN20_003095 [Parelaphostrongylus tenuis]